MVTRCANPRNCKIHGPQAEPEEDKNPFHEHLDTCEWCAAHPFDLCSTGAKLLKETALASVQR